ncbi:MAG TPA: hypothetical protein VHO06_23925 [Polyangia bacterium]|nr:hypothetical protein [Polyangia bacterium]
MTVLSFVAGLSVFGLTSAQAQDAQPPAGYPPPPAAAPADPNAPPPGAYPAAPPPAAYPPGAYPPPAAAPPPPPRSPFLGLPFIGVQSLQGDSGKGASSGLRVGGIGGVRINEEFSFNGEIVYDAVNVDNAASDESVYNVQIAVAPFFHAPVAPTADVVVGPKLGFARYGASASDYGYSVDAGDNSLLVGLNAGAFFRISPIVALGGLVSFDWEKPLSCSISMNGYSQSCDVSGAQSLYVISAGAGALF